MQKKKSGVIDLVNSKNIDEFLSKIEINDVWGVGQKLTKFYHQKWNKYSL